MKRRIAIAALLILPFTLSFGQKAEEEKKPTKASETAKAEAFPKVLLETSMGDIVIELNSEKAPISTKNFLSYVKSKHYNGTVFHRVIENFMIQGGGFAVDSGRLVEKPSGSPIKNEGQNGLKNDRGTIAMARTNAVDSATAQFFINVVDNAGLNYPSNGGYAVFGKVIKGMDVVDKIKDVKTGTNGMHENVPSSPVIIKSASVVE